MLTRAGKSVTIVDINPQSITLARRYFSLPHQTTCHVEDGAAFLARTKYVFDAIIIDPFIDERVPPHLCSKEFFHLVRERLAPTRCTFVNVFLQHGSDNMAHAGFLVRVLVSPGLFERNAIVMGGAVTDLHVPTLQMRPEVHAEEIAHELKEMWFRTGRRPWNSCTASDRESRCSEPQARQAP